jgi:hypothetical protein
MLKYLFIVFAAMAAVPPATALAELKSGGVTVTKGDANYNAITQNGTNALRVEIADKMIGSTQKFEYGNNAAVNKNYDFRAAVIDVVGKMGSQGEGAIDFGFAGKDVPLSYPPGFEKKPGDTSGGFKQSSSDQKASDGIKSIETGKTRTGCVAALDAAYLIAYRRAYGDATVDSQMPKGSVVVDSNFSPLVTGAGDNTRIPGDFVYMANPSDYQSKSEAKAKKDGKTGDLLLLWNGENAVYAGDGKYSGLGMQGKTESEMREALRNGYNGDTGKNMTPQEAADKIKFTTHGRPAINP